MCSKSAISVKFFVVFTALAFLSNCKFSEKKAPLLTHKFYLKEIEKHIEFKTAYRFNSIVYSKEEMVWGLTGWPANYFLLDSLNNEVLYFKLFKNDLIDSFGFEKYNQKKYDFQERLQKKNQSRYVEDIAAQSLKVQSIFSIQTNKGKIVGEKSYLRQTLTLKDMSWLLDRESIFVAFKNKTFFYCNLYIENYFIDMTFIKDARTSNNRLTDAEIFDIIKYFVDTVEFY